jgi:diacylglycerol kinase
MPDDFQKPPHRWSAKFANAFHGAYLGVRGQHSFAVHFVCTVLVLLLGVLLRVDWIEWSVLILCISAVLVAEMFNSALETLAKAIDTRHNPHLADGLNMASAAVLVCSVGAVIVGALVFGSRLIQVF